MIIIAIAKFQHKFNLVNLSQSINLSCANNTWLKVYIVHKYYQCDIFQVFAEFMLMCGEDCITKIAEKWNQYVPAILKFGNSEIPEVLSENFMYKAIEIADKGFRSSGAAAKSEPAFVIYEVSS